MLNLNLSLLTLTFYFFTRLVLLCLFQIFNDLFFVALSSFPKADTKVVQLSLPTKFFSNYFSKKNYFLCNCLINQANIFYSFLNVFGGVFNCYPNFATLLLKFKSNSEARWSISAANYFKFSDF